MPLFLLGPGIRKGQYLEAVQPIDIASTLAFLCGITLAASDGRVVSDEGGTMKGQSFSDAVLRVTRRIPPGRVATYGDVAAMAGRPWAARAVGNIMRACDERGVPCHRVVGAGGALGGYGGQNGLKRALLRAESLVVIGRRIRGLVRARWSAGGCSSGVKRATSAASPPGTR